MGERLYKLERRKAKRGEDYRARAETDTAMEVHVLVPVEPTPGTLERARGIVREPDRKWLQRMADAEDKCESVTAGCMPDEPDLIDKTLPKKNPYDTWADTVDDTLADLVRRVEELERKEGA